MTKQQRARKSSSKAALAAQSDPTRLASGKVQRFITPKVHSFWRTTPPVIVASGGVDTSFALAPTLANLGQSTDFTALFEQYRIKKLRVIFTCTTYNTVNDAQFPRLLIAPDYNDNAVETLPVLMGREGVISHTFTPTNPSITLEIEPKVALAVFRTIATTGYMSVPAGWIDSSYSDIPHYGFKYYIEHYNTTTSATRRVFTQLQALVETRCVV